MGSVFFRISAVTLLTLAFAIGQETANLGNTTRDGRLAPLLANLGDLHAPVTTSKPDAQRFFDQGLTLVYGFNHAEAVRSFREAARIDPECAMAHWGQALALAPNINDPAIGPDREQQGYRAMQAALARKSKASKKEQALIDALAARFAAKPPEGDRAALNTAYAEAMKKVNADFGRDPDVATLYADAMMNTRPWDYWTKEGKPRPGFGDVRTALENTIRDFPDHPGARHLYIHLMEASDEVDVAVPSADHLGPLVPAAGHLVHMPSHIYIRVGRYADAADANIKAITADEDYITQCRAQGIYPAAYYPHNIHFLAVALVMDGRSAEAMKAARKVATQHHHGELPETLAGFLQLLKAFPLLTMTRFGYWDDILKEPEPAIDQIFARAAYHFARGMALSAREKPRQAAAELAMLEKTRTNAQLQKLKILELNSLATLTDIALAMLKGDLAQKAGDHKNAIAHFTKAVALEDGLLYSEPPDWLIPPRTYLGDAYLAAGDAARAEQVFREDLKRHRNNGWSLYGLEKSLRAQNRAADADRVQSDFTRAWARADVRLAGVRF
jgi:tetratricopeptide (TPR) repeat protein